VAKPIEQKKVNDEFEFATDWSRNYVEIFTKLRWLNAYARINYIAAQKSLQKFMKSYFMISDNVLDKKLMKFLNEQTFTSKKNVKNILNEIVQSFASKFT